MLVSELESGDGSRGLDCLLGREDRETRTSRGRIGGAQRGKTHSRISESEETGDGPGGFFCAVCAVCAVWQLGNSAELLRCSLAAWHCLTTDCGEQIGPDTGRRELRAKAGGGSTHLLSKLGSTLGAKTQVGFYWLFQEMR